MPPWKFESKAKNWLMIAKLLSKVLTAGPPPGPAAGSDAQGAAKPDYETKDYPPEKVASVAAGEAASAALPLVLSPITLKNYAGTCGYQSPEWMVKAAHSSRPAMRQRGKELLSYLDVEKRPAGAARRHRSAPRARHGAGDR